MATALRHLKGLDEGPQEVPDALGAIQKFHQAHDTEESEKSDRNGGVFRGLGTRAFDVNNVRNVD